MSFASRLEPNAGHDEDDGKLKQALDAGEPAILHAQSFNLAGIRLARQQLLEYSNLV